MSERVTMPALGESVTEGTVTRWLKSVGDEVAVDEPLLEVSTDKVDTEIPSPVSGTLLEILANEDDTVPVGSDLAVIGDPSEGSGDSGAGAAQPAADEGNAGQSNDSGSTGEGDSSAAGAAAAGAPSGETSDNAGPEVAQDSGSQDSAQQDLAQQDSGQQAQGASQASAQGDSGSDSVQGGTTVTMPALGESVTEGTVTRWLKSEGDQVELDEPLLEVSTDKVDTEIPSPAAGPLTKILVSEDETVAVGADLAIIGGSAGGGQQGGQESTPDQASPQEQAATEEAAEEAKPSTDSEEPKGGEEGTSMDRQRPSEEQLEPSGGESGQASSGGQASSDAQPGPTQRVTPGTDSADAQSAGGEAGEKASGAGDSGDASAYVTPLVRKLATENDIDLSTVQGTGIGGRIRKQDVLDAVEAKQAKSAQASQPQASEPTQAAAGATPGTSAQAAPAGPSKRGTREKMTRLRKIIAQRMVESLQVSAQLTTVIEVDMTKVARVRDQAKSEFEKREGTKLSYLPFIALATVEALKAHPNINASVEGEEIVYHGTENLAIAVDTPKGLIVPVLKNAGDLNIAGLARGIADVAARTRDNKITPDDLAGGTFTITNTGSRGALFDTPILNQPQVAMLGTGAIVRRPVVIEADGAETIAIRSMMYLALSYDHRVVDGADAARFLATVKERLEEGGFESSLGL